jgi:excisionase family DNA binding protein
VVQDPTIVARSAPLVDRVVTECLKKPEVKGAIRAALHARFTANPNFSIANVMDSIVSPGNRLYCFDTDRDLARELFRMREAQATGSPWTVKQVAELLAVNQRTVHRMAQRGELQAFRVAAAWRFLEHDILAWIERQKQDAEAAIKSDEHECGGEDG